MCNGVSKVSENKLLSLLLRGFLWLGVAVFVGQPRSFQSSELIERFETIGEEGAFFFRARFRLVGHHCWSWQYDHRLPFEILNQLFGLSVLVENSYRVGSGVLCVQRRGHQKGRIEQTPIVLRAETPSYPMRRTCLSRLAFRVGSWWSLQKRGKAMYGRPLFMAWVSIEEHSHRSPT